MGGCQGHPGCEQRSWDPAQAPSLPNPGPVHRPVKEMWFQNRQDYFSEGNSENSKKEG